MLLASRPACLTLNVELSLSPYDYTNFQPHCSFVGGSEFHHDLLNPYRQNHRHSTELSTVFGEKNVRSVFARPLTGIPLTCLESRG